MNQYLIEKLIHPNHIKQDIIEYLKDDLPDHFHEAYMKVVEYINTQYWESKNNRLNILRHQDYYAIIDRIISTVATTARDKPFPLVSLIGMVNIANMTAAESMTTVAEILAIMKPIGFYKLGKIGDSYYIQSNFILRDDLQQRLDLYCYLPPMTEKPKTLTHNKSCGYLSIKSDSLILGNSYNYHDESISLDVLNTLNANEYELDMDFISNHTKSWHRDELNETELSKLSIEERNQYELDKATWINNQVQFNKLTELIQNKTIYFTHKIDKRGRVYSQGYHFNTQGSSFEKACINLKTKETVTGDL